MLKDIKMQGHEPRIAIKELTSDEIKPFQTELGMLRKIQELNHPHLINVMASFQRDRSYYFMFPLADGGNLREFWNREDSQPLTAELITWVLQQLLGLAGALKAVHNFSENQFGRHGDLKPENILVFTGVDGWQVSAHPVGERGILQIADVGLAKFHEAMTIDRNVATNTKSGTGIYEPPETDLCPERPRSRKFDIWSMGCIFLEFMIWLLRGSKEVERFNDWRRDSLVPVKRHKFYTIKNGTSIMAEIHPETRSWIDEMMYKDPRCEDDTALRDVLTLIVTRLLQIQVDDRADSAELHEKLKKIVKNAESKPSYLFNGAPAPIAPLGP